MKQNATLLLIENPLTGNGSVAKALKLSGGEKAFQTSSWVKPGEARELAAGWEDKTKIVIVRDVVARFQSGAALAINSSRDTLIDHGASTDFAEQAPGVRELPSAKLRFNRFVELVAESVKSDGWDAVPIYLHPQSHWLTAKFDLILATHDIANYFNIEAKVPCTRSNQCFNSPDREAFPYTTAPAASSHPGIREIYAEDVATLESLPVWSPVPGQVRFVTGWCPTCNRGEKVDVTPEQSGGTSAPAQTSAPVKKSKRKAARQQRKTKS